MDLAHAATVDVDELADLVVAHQKMKEEALWAFVAECIVEHDLAEAKAQHDADNLPDDGPAHTYVVDDGTTEVDDG